MYSLLFTLSQSMLYSEVLGTLGARCDQRLQCTTRIKLYTYGQCSACNLLLRGGRKLENPKGTHTENMQNSTQ